MKFGKTLASLSVPEWAPHYIRFKKLKHVINREEALAKGTLLNGKINEKSIFLDILYEEIERVSSFFTSRKLELETRIGPILDKCRFVTLGSMHSQEIIFSFLTALEEFCSDAQKLLRYAEINTLGFRKILKKHDKKLQTQYLDTVLKERVLTSVFNDPQSLLSYITLAEEMVKLLNDFYRNPSRVGNPHSHIPEDVIQMLKLDQKDNMLLYYERILSKDIDRRQWLSAVFRKCCQYHAIQCLDAILVQVVNINEVDDVNHRGVLHYLAMHGDVQMMERLLKEGALTHIPDTFGRLPIHYAAIHGHVACVRDLLLLYREDHQDHEGYTPLYYAVIYGHTDVVTLLLTSPISTRSFTSRVADQPRQESLLALACLHGHAALAELLIKQGDPVNQVDENGESPLHHCCRRGYEECVRLLLSRGANLHQKNTYMLWTPLFLAVSKGHTNIVDILLQANADISCVDIQGWLPLDHAVYRGHLPIARRLQAYQQEKQCLKATSNGNANGNANGNGLESLPTHTSTTSLPAVNGDSTKANTAPLIKVYGHDYLVNECLVEISPVTLDTRRPLTFIQLDDKLALNASSTYKLYISSSDASHPQPPTRYCVDWPARQLTDLFHFRPASLEHFSLSLDLVASYQPDVVLARAIVLPFHFAPKSGRCCVPLLNARLQSVGCVTFDFLALTPCNHPRIASSPSQRPPDVYWKSLKVIGHRGSGAENAARAGQYQRSHVTENTMLSFVVAASLGAEYVEFDVQVTRDGVPVIYHDWTIHDPQYEIPVHTVSAQEFKNLKKSRRVIDKEQQQQQQQQKSPSEGKNLHKWGTWWHDWRQKSRTVHSLHLEDRSYSLETPLLLDEDCPKSSRSLIDCPYTTLEETLNRVPVTLSFNVEVKYPDPLEAEEHGLVSMMEVNAFVDTILRCVFDHVGERQILFSSFSPAVCLALNWKQSRYPVLFLTEAGMHAMADPRCLSLQSALKFARSARLFGIVSHSGPLLMAPNIIRKIKESGLLLCTYSGNNNNVDNVKLQEKYGVDAVIVDHVAHVRRGLLSHQ